MSVDIVYDGGPLGYNVKPTKVGVTTRADGEAAFSGFLFEDPDAASLTLGHRPVTVEEDTCAQPRLFTGFATQRDFGRSAEDALGYDALQRAVDMTLVDMNAALGFRQITRTGTGGGNRPAETWIERLTWILESEYLSEWISSDQTWIIQNTQVIEAADYRGAYPSAVLDDLADRTGNAYIPFVFWDPAASEVRLSFRGEDQVIGACPLAISNVEADVDGATVFFPDMVAKLAREPDQTYSDVTVVYDHGKKKLYRSRPSTYATYVRRGTEIQRPYTRSVATATAQAEAWLDKHSVETDRITCVIQVPAASVGLIQAGQSIQARFSHLGPPYRAAGGATMRIVSYSPRPTTDIGDLYDVALELVYRPPLEQECVTAVTFSDLEVTGTKGYNPTSWPHVPPVPHDGNPTVSITPPAGSSCVILAGAVVNIFSASSWTSGAGYTTLYEDMSYDGHPLVAALYRAVASPSGAYTPNGTFDYSGETPYPTTWAMAAIAIQSGDSAPVQEADDVFPQSHPNPVVTLPSSPTAGNAIVMILLLRDWISYGTGGVDPVPYPDDGRWVLLGHTGAVNWESPGQDEIFFFARCVAEGDGDTYGRLPGYGGPTIVLTEWTASGSSDDTTDLGPTPGATTEHTVDPTVDDDETLGYTTPGMLWINTDTGDVFVLVDGTDGAAVWEQINGAGVTDHGDLTGLLDDDHTQYVLKRFGGKEVVSTVAASGATETLDLADGNVFDLTLSDDCVLTFAGATNGVACGFTLLLRQDGTGGWDTTWPGSVVWAGGSAPVLDQTASTVAVLTFFTIDGGTTWYGFPTGAGGASIGATVTDETTWGIVPDAGVSTDASAADHTHGSPPSPPGEILVASGTSGTGDNVSSYVEMDTPDSTTSATLEDIVGATTTITLQTTSHIAAWLNCHVSATGLACDLGLAINFDGVDHDEITVHLTLVDEGNAAVVHRTTTALPPGTYTVKGRFRRQAGSGTPSVDRADLLVMAMGHEGPIMLTTSDGTDYLYASTP